jgi:hypothetical protein
MKIYHSDCPEVGNFKRLKSKLGIVKIMKLRNEMGMVKQERMTGAIQERTMTSRSQRREMTQ